MVRVFLLIIALASGGLSAWLVSAKDPADPNVQTVEIGAPPITMAEVLIAVRDIERGAQVTATDLTWQTWPANAVTDAFVLHSERPDAPTELTGWIARGSMMAGEPIASGKLAPPGSSLLSSVLTSGMRAVAIAISAGQSAGGFILPDDRVDVVLRMPCRANEGCGGSNARTILTNVRVLAIDQSGSGDPAEGTVIGKTATLELTPGQAETIVGAEASGTLSLILRSAADHGQSELVRQPVPAKVRTVKVWRSGSTETVAVE